MAPERRAKLTELGVILSLIGLTITLLSSAVRFGQRDAQIDKKLDREEYYRDIGQIQADLRVLRCRVAKDCQ